MSTHRFASPSTVARRVVGVALATPLAMLGWALHGADAGASPSPFLQAISIKGSAPVLVNSSHDTLYVLSDEKSGHLHCTGACLGYWPAVLVKKNVTKVSVGSGVKGKIGFIARAGGMKQVTFDSFPLYRFAGDAGAAQTGGEGLSSYGGTWYAVKAAATSPSTVAVTSFTTTTTSGGAY